jgi:hypothetical protein
MIDGGCPAIPTGTNRRSAKVNIPGWSTRATCCAETCSPSMREEAMALEHRA